MKLNISEIGPAEAEIWSRQQLGESEHERHSSILDISEAQNVRNQPCRSRDMVKAIAW
jgi:hypothetical protein